ncbi:MAG: PD40 domain-containing protein [Bacteroidales bacterium]|nr:PD40 domain-containing protein [Bacteroidales bacterium]
MKTLVTLLFIFVFIIVSGCNKDEEEEIDINRDDSGVKLNIELDGSMQNPAFSPDGNSFIFTRFRNGYNQEPADLFIYNFQTEQITTLVSDGSGNVNLPGSTWNDSINSIVFSSSRDPHDEIYLIQESGTTGSETKITNRTDSVAYEPSMNPDGQWIVFESHKLDVEDNGIITKFKIDGSSSYIQLTSSTNDCRQPNWSPTGDKILFQQSEAGQWDIWIMDTNGTNKSKVTSGPGDKTDACFTQDGQYIIFSSDFELDYANIYRIPITGGTPEQLSFYSGYDGAPSISPDGLKIIFESVNGDPDDSQGTFITVLDL